MQIAILNYYRPTFLHEGDGGLRVPDLVADPALVFPEARFLGLTDDHRAPDSCSIHLHPLMFNAKYKGARSSLLKVLMGSEMKGRGMVHFLEYL